MPVLRALTDLVTSKRVRLPQRVQRQRVCSVGSSIMVETLVAAREPPTSCRGLGFSVAGDSRRTLGSASDIRREVRDPAVGVQTSLGRPRHPATRGHFLRRRPRDDRGRLDPGITEIGAVKVRAGEVPAEFGSRSIREMPIPAFVSVLTGITDAAVAGAPSWGRSCRRFAPSSRRTPSPWPTTPLRHRLLEGSIPRVGLPVSIPGARHRGVGLAGSSPWRGCPTTSSAPSRSTSHAGTRPNHRAPDDARATVDVLHGLLERVGASRRGPLEELLGYFGEGRGCAATQTAPRGWSAAAWGLSIHRRSRWETST